MQAALSSCSSDEEEEDEELLDELELLLLDELDELLDEEELLEEDEELELLEDDDPLEDSEVLFSEELPWELLEEVWLEELLSDVSEPIRSIIEGNLKFKAQPVNIVAITASGNTFTIFFISFPPYSLKCERLL